MSKIKDVVKAEIDVQENSAIVILGKRNSGKSFLCKYLLRGMLTCDPPKADVVFLISPTEKLSRSFNCFDDKFIIPGFDMKRLEKILKAQQKCILRSKLGKDDPKVKKILLIFDDCLGSIRNGSEEQLFLNKLFATSRHSKIGLIILSQSSRGAVFGPVARDCVDPLFVRSMNKDQLPLIFESCFCHTADTSLLWNFTRKRWLCRNVTII